MPEYGTIFWITSLILVVGYIALEISRGFLARSGTVVKLIESKIPIASILEREMEVTLDNGERIIAKATGCSLCQSAFAPGVRVCVLKDKRGWLISSTNRKSFKCGKVR